MSWTFFSPQLNRQSHLICSWIWENNVMYASELTTTAGKTNFPGGIRRLMKSDWFLLIPANVGPLHQISWSSPAFYPQRNDLILDKHRVIHPGSWIIHSIVHSRWGWHGLWGLLFFGAGGWFTACSVARGRENGRGIRQTVFGRRDVARSVKAGAWCEREHPRHVHTRWCYVIVFTV